MKITVHVKPNSKKEGIEIQEDGSFIVRVNVPPTEGKANQRVIELLAKHLNCSKSCLALIKGHKSKTKIFNLD